MKVNQTICCLLFIFLIFIAFVYYKKQLENFKELVIKTRGNVAIESRNPETGYRFKRICIGETCMDGNVLASVINMFRINNNSLRKEATCSDDVCIFPQHLKHFDNSKDFQPPMIKEGSIKDTTNIDPFPKRYNVINKGDAFRLSLSDSTDTILKDFGTDLSKLSKPLTTKMLSGRICYSPGEKYPLELENRTGTSLVGIPTKEIEFKRFRYFDYDKSRNVSNTRFSGSEGIYNYTNCYQDVDSGDYKYFSKLLGVTKGVQTNNKLIDMNLTTSMDTLQPIPFDFPQYTIGFQMGKPYDSTFVIKNNSEKAINRMNQSSSQEAGTKQTSSSRTKPIAN